jgi:hypothetical protein
MITDLTDPVIVATLPASAGPALPLLIDRTHRHRVFKAHATGAAELPAYLLTEAETPHHPRPALKPATGHRRALAASPARAHRKEPGMTGLIKISIWHNVTRDDAGRHTGALGFHPRRPDGEGLHLYRPGARAHPRCHRRGRLRRLQQRPAQHRGRGSARAISNCRFSPRMAQQGTGSWDFS